METSWQNITRRLDINQVSRDTTYDKSRGKGRAIKKVPYTFTIPSVTFRPSTLGITSPFSIGALICQFNYTAPRAFKLLSPAVDPNGTSGFNSVFPAIRYRVGNAVYRYQLRWSAVSSVNDEQMRRLFKVACPLYEGEVIQPNFTIEYYAFLLSVNNTTTKPAITVLTNLLAIPSDESETSVAFDAPTTVMRNEIAETFPEPLPTVYPDASAWLTN